MSTIAPSTVVRWPDDVDEIFGGDLVVAVGTPTPRGGVVLVNVCPLGLRDRDAGVVRFTTSLGFGRKLDRIAADPRIAVAYHTRQHGHSARPGYVLVQGRATVTEFVGDWVLERAREYDPGQLVTGRFWDWWLRVYYWDRVLVDVRAQRVLWWPDGDTTSEPMVLGDPLPADAPPSQPRPRAPETPRVSLRKVTRDARRGHRLIGVLQADGMPLILPAQVAGTNVQGLILAAGSPLPPGERRAGFLAHNFHPGLKGLWTATHTGWLRGGPSPTWTPHTRHYFYAPPIKPLLLLGNGLAARLGYRRAMKQRAKGPPRSRS